MKATLVLEDGSSFEGVSVSSKGERIGEVILNTAVVGYQEMMTDPSNAGKILVLTYPLIGNYGTAKKFYESRRCWLAGLVIKEVSRISSNWQSEMTFDDFLKKEGVLAISDVDTRTVATTIRDKSEMFGIISTESSNKTELLAKLKDLKDKHERSNIKDISIKKITRVLEPSGGPEIAVIDTGMLNSFMKQLETLGCGVTLVPYTTDAKSILSIRPDAVIVPNGPEDDEANHRLSDTVRELLGRIPVMGIAAGHLTIARALGMSIKKLPVGHHGVNYPVKSDGSYKGEITVQNHSYVVDEDSARSRKDVTVTLRNINDNTIEEMESRSMKFISFQYYPVSPGFGEPNAAFTRFLKTVPQKRRGKAQPVKAGSAEVQHAKA